MAGTNEGNRMSSDPKRPISILNDQPNELGAMLAKASLLAKLQVAFSSLLDKTLAKNCQVANATPTALLVLVNNGTTATQLKFMTPELLQCFKNTPALAHLNELTVKVRPPVAPSQRITQKEPHRPCTPLSPQSADTLKQTADGIEDEKLKAALLRLARNAKI